MTGLAHTLLTAPGATPGRWMFFLHGILGSRSNWRGFAHKWVARRPDWGAVLVDLRMHGDSQGSSPPHTVEACARDLLAVRAELERPIGALLGHSFGGKVALAFATECAEIEEAWLIDSMPGARPPAAEPGSPLHILDLLTTMPTRYASREVFVEALSDARIEPAVGRWLAMNLEASGGEYRLRLDLEAVRALLIDYLARDDWAGLEVSLGRLRLHVVAAGRSSVWSAEDLARADAIARQGSLSVHRMPEVGHWIHVEDPVGLLELVAPGGRAYQT